MDTASFNPVEVHAAHDHVTFVAADGSVYGMGKHANSHDYSGNKEQEALRKIEFPEGITGSDIQKVHVGKFSRCAWTKDGHLLFNGHAKWYNFTNTNTEASNETFKERFENNFFRLEDDKIADWVSGYHYNAILTEKGVIHCQGYCFWRNFSSEIRHNNENYEDNPFRVSLPEGYKKAVKLFPAMKGHRLYANLAKEDG